MASAPGQERAWAYGLSSRSVVDARRMLSFGDLDDATRIPMTDITPGATTGDHIALHAAKRPDAVALVNRARAISYAEFSRDIGRVTPAIREFGLPSRSAVAVGCDDHYLQWLLLLAFERLSIATASYHDGEGPAEYGELLAGVDLVLSEEHFPIVGAK